MLRTSLACTLFALGVTAPAAASAEDVAPEDAAESVDVESVDAESVELEGPAEVAPDAVGCGVAPREVEPTPLAVPDRGPTNWCERPDDPRCAPASPAPSGFLASSALPAALPPLAPPHVSAPRVATPARPHTSLLGERAGITSRIERPPA